MVLYGYDASVYNSLQNSANWFAYFNRPQSQLIGAVNTAYTVGAIIAGWFVGGPVADKFGRRLGMAIGASLTIIATFMQAFSPKGMLGVFIAGRVLIGLGQGIALSMLAFRSLQGYITNGSPSCRTCLYWRIGTSAHSWEDYDILANVFQCWKFYCLLDQL